MNISRFFGITSREAMRQVRMALGPDALIVSNRRVGGGVEILAADASGVPPNASAPVTPTVAIEPSHGSLKSTPGRQPDYGNASEAGVLHAIGTLQGALEGRLDELLWSHQMRHTPVALSLFQQLLASGFSITLLRALLRRLPETLGERAAMQWVRAELEQRLPMLRSEEQLWQPGLALALVGPTGVGKTTTLAKLAARAVRRFGPEQVVLITTDTYRIGAHEQLKIYGDLLRIPVHVVQDAQQLRQVLLAQRPDQLILIDNVGISQRDQYVLEQASLLANTGRRIQRLLVLNAGSQGDTLDEVARSYSKDGGTPLIGCIISKLDEAIRLGATLDTAIRFKLPVHYVSDGQKVPENLRYPSAADLVGLSLQSRHHNAALFTPSQADLAAMLNHDSRVDVQYLQREHERRVALLPKLLAAATPTDFGVLSVEQTSAALGMLDDSALFTEAFDLWRAASDLSAQGATEHNASVSQRLLQTALQELSEPLQQPALVSHVLRASAPGQAEQQLFSTVFTPTGQVLCTPYYQTLGAASWSNSLGEQALEQRLPMQAICAAMNDIQALSAAHTIWHLCSAGTPTQVRLLLAQPCNWIAHISPTQKIWHKGIATLPSAIAKEVVFDAVPDLASSIRLQGWEDMFLGELSLWYASTPVQYKARGQEDVALHMLTLRVVRRSDGQLLKSFYALYHHQYGPILSFPQMAAGVLASITYQESLRWHNAMQTHLQGLGVQEPHPLLVAQLSLAAANVVYGADNQLVCRVAAALLGTKQLKKSQAVPALLKLLILKEAIS